MKTIRDFDLFNKRILVRCDFNVPLDDKGFISDDFKIKETLPTINYLIKNKAKIILMSHLDNQDSKVTSNLDMVKERLEELLNISVRKTGDCVGKEVKEQANSLKGGEILLLENLRFHGEEIDNNQNFAKQLSSLGDIFINDAFAVSHRAHASVVGVPKFLPHGAGFLIMKEIENLKKILENPKKPMAAVIGGKKVETKSKFINKISEYADFVLVSGLIKKEIIDKKLKFRYSEKIIGPSHDLDALDIDSETIEIFCRKILSSKAVVWNGPFGKFEDGRYKKGTLEIAKAIIKSKAFSVVGGGETVEFLAKESLISKFSHVSTGGGAMLQFLSGEKLPGIEALE